jgi:hypothetical protein
MRTCENYKLNGIIELKKVTWIIGPELWEQTPVSPD